jgi:excinuclease UvrABC nuclease subunit
MQALSKEIESKLSLLPDQPGVYLWKIKRYYNLYRQSS